MRGDRFFDRSLEGAIALKEANETQYWLELLHQADNIDCNHQIRQSKPQQLSNIHCQLLIIQLSPDKHAELYRDGSPPPAATERTPSSTSATRDCPS
jgi:hypothetical protein